MDRSVKKELSPSARRVQELLTSMNFDIQIIEYLDSTRTSAEAAERAGCQIGQIVKSLIFRGQTSGNPILVLTSGANRVDELLISQYTHEAIDRPDAEYVRTTTGFSIGGVPPIGHLTKPDTYIDEDLLIYEFLWAAGGTPNAIYKLSPQELLSMTQGKIVRVKKEV